MAEILEFKKRPVSTKEPGFYQDFKSGQIERKVRKWDIFVRSMEVAQRMEVKQTQYLLN